MATTKDITFRIIDGDLNLSETLYQVIYLSLFGSVTDNWWANSLLFEEQPQMQYECKTQKVLNNTVLNSSGRLDIIRAVESDLSSLSDVFEYEVDVEIKSVNRVAILIYATEKETQENELYTLLWDNAKKEVIINE